MIHDQAAELRELVRRVQSRERRRQDGPQLIVVKGGMPGVGATTVALGITKALAFQGRHVVLVDADLDSAGATALLKVTAERTVLDVFSKNASASDALVPIGENLRFLAGLWGSSLLLESFSNPGSQLVDELIELSDYNAVVIDAGCSRGPVGHDLWNAANSLLLVTTGADAAVMGAYAMMKTFGSDEQIAPVKLMVNQVPDATTANGIAGRLAHSAKHFLNLNVELLAWAGSEPAMSGYDGGILTDRSAMTDDRAGRLFNQLAGELTGYSIAEKAGETLPAESVVV